MRNYIVKLFHNLIEARQREADRRIARMQLNSLSDRELRDINISRADINRLV